MRLYNQSRSWIIQIIFAVAFLIIIAQLLHLQVFSSEYRMQAESNARYRKVIYPDRGIIYDRKHRPILENTIMFDLMVTPNEVKGIDTLGLCKILNIDVEEFKKRLLNAVFKNTSYKSSVFVPLLTPQLYAQLNENMYKFPGFVLSERPVRDYPYNVAASVLGYLAEVDTGFLRRHRGEGYEMGDYTGMTGLERTYEKVLMGQRGIQYFIRDNRSRLQGRYENGNYDTTAIAGKSLHLSLDVELQQLGEKLMGNKVGSIVAIDPKTGGVLCMISSPTYNPNYLTGSERRSHYMSLLRDPRLPLNNRAVGLTYSPGSTFKTVVGIIGMAEHVIDDKMTIGCSGAYYGCGRKMGCHAAGTFSLRDAISHSCNTYFAVTFRKTLDQARYGRPDSSLSIFNDYAYSFGLGQPLGVDIPWEKRGNIPTSKYYRKIFGKNWNSCNIVSNSIGQGEVETTLAQLANVMAIIANKGWYYTPHLVDSIDGGDEDGLLEKYKIKHRTLNIPDTVFGIVQDGMQGTMEFGTGAAAQVPGIVVCGKTGTVQNPFGKDHAFFGAFAPRENPRIAIAVMCENAGFGASSAAPIASLIIEKYLKDSIQGNERKNRVEEISKMNLIPERMRRAMDSLAKLHKEDSIRRSQKQSGLIEEEKEMDEELDSTLSEKPSNITQPTKENNPPAKDTPKRKPQAAVLPVIDEKKKNHGNGSKKNHK